MSARAAAADGPVACPRRGSDLRIDRLTRHARPAAAATRRSRGHRRRRRVRRLARFHLQRPASAAAGPPRYRRRADARPAARQHRRARLSLGYAAADGPSRPPPIRALAPRAPCRPRRGASRRGRGRRPALPGAGRRTGRLRHGRAVLARSARPGRNQSSMRSRPRRRPRSLSTRRRSVGTTSRPRRPRSTPRR